MIEGYLGKPGGGKSYGATAEILRTLETTDSVVVTNVALDLGAMAAYFAAKGKEIDVLGRVYILKDDEAGTFWRYRLRRREPGEPYATPVRLQPVYDGESKPPTAPEGTPDDGPEWTAYWVAHRAWAKAQEDYRRKEKVQAESFDAARLFAEPEAFPPHLYVIDECGLLFNSRCWMQRGRELTYWAAQHRKLGDTAVLIVQAASMIDKSLRELAQSWTVYSNGAYRNLGSFIRAPRYVFWRRYTGMPGPGNEPECTGKFSVDPAGVGSCYSSRAGVGMRGVGAPPERRAKGLHPAVLVLVPFVLAGGFWLLLRGVYGVVGPEVAKATNSLPSAVVAAAAPAALPQPLVIAAPSPDVRTVTVRSNAVVAARDVVTGYVSWSPHGVREERWFFRSGRVVTRSGGIVREDGFPLTPATPAGVMDAPAPPQAGPVFIPKGGNQDVPGIHWIPRGGRRSYLAQTNEPADSQDELLAVGPETEAEPEE